MLFRKKSNAFLFQPQEFQFLILGLNYIFLVRLLPHPSLVVNHHQDDTPGDSAHYFVVGESALRNQRVNLSERAMGRVVFLR